MKINIKQFNEDKTSIINRKLSQIASNEEIQNYISFFKKHNTLEKQIDWNLGPEDLKISIDTFIKNFNTNKEKKEKEKEEENEVLNYFINKNLIYENDEFYFFKIENYGDAKFADSYLCFSGSAKWCIGDSSTQDYFNNYIETSAFVLAVNKNWAELSKDSFSKNNEIKYMIHLDVHKIYAEVRVWNAKDESLFKETFTLFKENNNRLNKTISFFNDNGGLYNILVEYSESEAIKKAKAGAIITDSNNGIELCTYQIIKNAFDGQKNNKPFITIDNKSYPLMGSDSNNFFRLYAEKNTPFNLEVDISDFDTKGIPYRINLTESSLRDRGFDAITISRASFNLIDNSNYSSFFKVDDIIELDQSTIKGYYVMLLGDLFRCNVLSTFIKVYNTNAIEFSKLKLGFANNLAKTLYEKEDSGKPLLTLSNANVDLLKLFSQEENEIIFDEELLNIARKKDSPIILFSNVSIFNFKNEKYKKATITINDEQIPLNEIFIDDVSYKGDSILYLK